MMYILTTRLQSCLTSQARWSPHTKCPSTDVKGNEGPAPVTTEKDDTIMPWILPAANHKFTKQITTSAYS